jgi:hypothetical protein
MGVANVGQCDASESGCSGVNVIFVAFAGLPCLIAGDCDFISRGSRREKPINFQNESEQCEVGLFKDILVLNSPLHMDEETTFVMVPFFHVLVEDEPNGSGNGNQIGFDDCTYGYRIEPYKNH